MPAVDAAPEGAGGGGRLKPLVPLPLLPSLWAGSGGAPRPPRAPPDGGGGGLNPAADGGGSPNPAGAAGLLPLPPLEVMPDRKPLLLPATFLTLIVSPGFRLKSSFCDASVAAEPDVVGGPFARAACFSQSDYGRSWKSRHVLGVTNGLIGSNWNMRACFDPHVEFEDRA